MAKRVIKGPVVLVVLDGWGLSADTSHNGVALAKTPTYDHLVEKYSFTQLLASGEAVGLPEGQMGNSEVGHTTIGAGTVLYQDLVRIGKDVQSDGFNKNPAFQQVFDHVNSNHSQLHIMGILSAGGVHGHQEHIFATIRAAQAAGIEKIIIHAFLDGRDGPKTDGVSSLEQLEAQCEQVPGLQIGSVMGRYYSMDRDTNWDRTERAFNAIFHGQAEHIYETTVQPSTIIKEWYHQQVYDEHLEPMVFKRHDGTALEVSDGDGIIFTNFRKDRARQLSSKIADLTNDHNLKFMTMAKYGTDIESIVAYKPEKIEATLGEAVSLAGLKQLHIAETEKFPHVTYFFNGGRENSFEGEVDIVIPSRKDVKTHDEAPEMQAKEICEAAVKNLRGEDSPQADFIFMNFANADMVGHTANEQAVITAVETVDTELKKLVDAVLEQDGALLIIADHGNAEMIIDPNTGEPHTAHTINPVPCILVHSSYQPTLRNDSPGLKDVAPTILELLGVEKPAVMSGVSVIEK